MLAGPYSGGKVLTLNTWASLCVLYLCSNLHDRCPLVEKFIYHIWHLLNNQISECDCKLGEGKIRGCSDYTATSTYVDNRVGDLSCKYSKLANVASCYFFPLSASAEYGMQGIKWFTGLLRRLEGR